MAGCGSFRCNTCGLEFSALQTMKDHYEGQLHADNVKRRVNGLVPLTAQAHGARSRIATSVATTSYKCAICDKRFATPQTLASHLQSQKHKEKKLQHKLRNDAKAKAQEAQEAGEEKAAAAEGEEEEDEEDEASSEVSDEILRPDAWEESADRVPEDEDLCNTDCLFCNRKAPNTEEALVHMSRAHGFSLPLADRVVDMDGLVSYLARKINGAICLVCPKMFETRIGCQAHMASTGHCMLKLEGGEYADFYESDMPFQTEAAGSKAVGELLALRSGAMLKSKHEKKTHQTPLQYANVEPLPQEKKMLQERQKAHMTLLQMSRYSALLVAKEKVETKREKRQERNSDRYMRKQRMRLGVHLNNQHGKGYQGDYVGKTI
eukprot:Rhum_TRINITY_DN10375_c0_g1::Rhum_TRINITY_DN10375_c0_g1_i1::g.38195::m.38195/K14816/REI1; pre-60S factor REI1